MTYKEMLRELGMLSLEKRKMCVYGGNLAAVCLCLMGDYREDRVRLISLLNKDKSFSFSPHLPCAPGHNHLDSFCWTCSSVLVPLLH